MKMRNRAVGTPRRLTFEEIMTENERAVINAAQDIVALWKAQRIAGATRAERNAAIEETRDRLIAAVDSLPVKPMAAAAVVAPPPANEASGVVENVLGGVSDVLTGVGNAACGVGGAVVDVGAAVIGGVGECIGGILDA